MPSICCAVGCGNSKAKKSALTFYNIPINPERRERWIAAIKRDLWTPTIHTRLCSQHFISGKKSENPLCPDYVPSLFAYLSPNERRKKINCYKTFERTQAVKRKRNGLHAVEMPPRETTVGVEPDNSANIPKQEESGPIDDHCYCKVYSESSVTCSNEACQATAKKLTEECTKLRAEVCELKAKVDRLSFQQVAFKDNDKMVQDFTGLPSYTKLMVVFTLLSGHLKDGSGLSPFHCFLMTLMRMRLNLPLHFLTYIFHVSKPTARRIFESTLNVMHSRLSAFIVWPSQGQIQMSLPACFRDSCYRNCTSIVDCFEIFTERPKNTRARAPTCTQCKRHNTVKYLISLTPQGLVSFVSSGWEGQASNKHITQNCGYLENLSPGELVLADQEFTVGDSAGLHGAPLKTAVITNGKRQLHSNELAAERGPLNVWIHVERVIGLVRNKYTILHSMIPVSLCRPATPGELTSLDKMVIVCCALCNVSASVVPPE